MNTITIDYVTFVWDTKTVSEAIHALGLSASTLDYEGWTLSVRAHPAGGEHLYRIRQLR